MYSIIDVEKLGFAAREDSLEEITAIAQNKCIRENQAQYIVKLIARIDPYITTTISTFDKQGEADV